MTTSLFRIASLFIVTMVLAIAAASAQTSATQASNTQTTVDTKAVGKLEFSLIQLVTRPKQRAGHLITPDRSTPSLQAPLVPLVVLGGGTPGRVPKWTKVTLLNSFIGDSNMFEDSAGKVGIGTTTPTSLLTVQGLIETKLGGFKFPDGTIQTTAFNSGQVVRSLNGLTGDVQLAEGANINITQAGNTLTIAAANALTGVTTDDTLTGNGTATTPLGIAVPAVLAGFAQNQAIFYAFNQDTNSNSTGLQGQAVGGNGVNGSTSSTDPDRAGVFGSCDGCNGVYGDSQSGNGVHGASTSGYAMYANGNAGQARDRGGWVKAMAYVNEDGTIARCYNGITNSSSGNCGFSSNRFAIGFYDINFGFQVDDRFINLQPINNLGSPGGCGGGSATVNTLSGNVARITTGCEGLGTNKPFLVFVF